MNKLVFEKTKEHVAKAMGVSSYSDVVYANETQVRQMVLNAAKRAKIKTKRKPKTYSYGNPYVILSRKVNNRGKKV